MAGATDGEWSLYWTSRGRPVSARLAPVLAGWGDLDQREEAADIGPGHPILIDPHFAVVNRYGANDTTLYVLDAKGTIRFIGTGLISYQALATAVKAAGVR